MALLVADRSDRGKLRFSGEQDLWFLHQIMTQDFEGMQPGDAVECALLTPHGRMVGYMETLRTDDGVLAHFEPGLLPDFPEAIRHYVFATRVDIEDLTDTHGLILVAGDGWEEAAGNAAPGAELQPTRALGLPAGYVWLETNAVPTALEALTGAGAELASDERLEAIRIEHGIPRWGKEMDTKTIPQEAGIDDWAVHFDKGCYVGQEAMAKIHFRGKVNRRLARLEGETLIEGAEVTAGGTKVGTVTSVSDGAGLAIVKGSIEPGTEVEVGGRNVKVVA
jgi:folate-binding protein YgfZ